MAFLSRWNPLARLRRELAAQIRRTADVVVERDGFALEAAAYKWRAEQAEKRETERLRAVESAPMRCDAGALAEARKFLKAHGKNDECLPHASVLLDRAIFERMNYPLDPAMSEAEMRFHLGGASSLLAYKAELAAAIAEEKKP